MTNAALVLHMKNEREGQRVNWKKKDEVRLGNNKDEKYMSVMLKGQLDVSKTKANMRHSDVNGQNINIIKQKNFKRKMSS